MFTVIHEMFELKRNTFKYLFSFRKNDKFNCKKKTLLRCALVHYTFSIPQLGGKKFEFHLQQKNREVTNE